VYRAVDIYVGRFAAVKVVAEKYLDNREALLRFEARAARRPRSTIEHLHGFRDRQCGAGPSSPWNCWKANAGTAHEASRLPPAEMLGIAELWRGRSKPPMHRHRAPRHQTRNVFLTSRVRSRCWISPREGAPPPFPPSRSETAPLPWPPCDAARHGSRNACVHGSEQFQGAEVDGRAGPLCPRRAHL